jgi:hypothetical protein
LWRPNRSIHHPLERFWGFGGDLLQSLVEKVVADRIRIDDEQRRQIGVDPAEKRKLHENAARDRNVGDAGACGPDRARVIVKHEYDDFVGECQVLQDDLLTRGALSALRLRSMQWG